MFRYQKADPEARPRRRTIHLRQAGAFILLATQGTGPSPPTEAACPLTLLLRLCLRCPLPRDEHLIPTVATASETPTGWSITMRNTEPVLTACPGTMTGVPVPSHLLRLLPLRWLGNVSESGPLTRMSGVRSPLLLRPTWPGTAAPSDELRLLCQLVTGTPTSAPGSPLCPGFQCMHLRCMQLHAQGIPSQREGPRSHHHHLDMQAIRHMGVIQGENREWMVCGMINHIDKGLYTLGA